MSCKALFQKQVVAVGLLLWSFSLYAAVLSQVTSKQSDRAVLIQLQFNQMPTYKIFRLENPERLVLDLKNTQLKAKLPNFSQADLPIAHMRAGINQGVNLRVVFDLKQKLSYQVLPDKKAMQLKLKVALPAVTQKAERQETLPQTQVLPIEAKKGLRDVIVVIDPGHGGKDPGARGPDGTQEKDVVLAISKQLQMLINQQPGMHAYLTRKSDYFITLRQRLTIAREYKPDIFMAIHADSYPGDDATGSSVYALSLRGATSEAARWLADKENNSELGSVDLDHLYDQSGLLRSVLIDLSQTATIGASLQFGNQLLHALSQVTAIHRKRVEQARFVVLKSPDIPSVLVETGFISNPDEAKKLANQNYQQTLAKAMLAGIKRYFYDYPPPNTKIASLRLATSG